MLSFLQSSILCKFIFPNKPFASRALNRSFKPLRSASWMESVVAFRQIFDLVPSLEFVHANDTKTIINSFENFILDWRKIFVFNMLNLLIFKKNSCWSNVTKKTLSGWCFSFQIGSLQVNVSYLVDLRPIFNRIICFPENWYWNISATEKAY